MPNLIDNLYMNNHLLFDTNANLYVGSDGNGKTYYVDVNAGLDTNDGLSWDKAFKTYAVAVTASNTNIAAGASGWAARNRIFYKGDNAEAAKETIIALPNKCDVIGVGSYDHHPFPIMIGNHVPIGSSMGCRFINMGFQSLAAGGAIMTLITTLSGVEFIDCEFIGSSTTAATYGLVATAVEMLKIAECRFIGLFSVAAISLGAGATNGLLIEDNIVESAAIGILVNTALTTVYRNGIIRNNLFDVGTLVVDDVSDNLVCVGNRGATAANGSLDETFNINALICSDNIFSCSAGTQSYYPAYAAIPA